MYVVQLLRVKFFGIDHFRKICLLPKLSLSVFFRKKTKQCRLGNSDIFEYFSGSEFFEIT